MEAMSRRHDLDFLRVAAFMLLIVYHVSLMYNSRSFLLKSQDSSAMFDVIHLWTHPWRMSLLFLISGVVTGILLTRQAPQALRSARTRQLLAPLLAGVLLLIPPQMYVYLNAHGGVDISLLDVFWHYLTLTPVPLPDGSAVNLLGMQHLWYLAYLWAYTAILTLALSVWPGLLRRAGDWLMPWLAGKSMLILPAMLFILMRLALLPVFPPTLDILTDWYSHAVYLASFLLGAMMATRSDCWDTIVRMRKPALILALACALSLAILSPTLPGEELESWRQLAGRTLGGTFQWCAIIAILGYARIWLNLENAVIRYLNRAILTYYVLHQTVMLLVAYGLHQFGLMSASIFIPIVIATLAICALAYELKQRLEASWRLWSGARVA